jgi:Uma2 family endonuclease
VDFQQVPLAQEDLLHPQEDDFHVQTYGHIRDCMYLHTILRGVLQGVAGVWVFGDMRTDFGVEGLEPLGPDLEVFADVPENWGRGRGTFYRNEANARPLLVIEVTSASSRKNDLGVKVDYYRQAGVPVYALVDRYDDQEPPVVSVLGFRLTAEGYVPIPLDARGRLWLEPVRLWLAVESGEAVLYAENGARYDDPANLVQNIRQAMARVEELEALMDEEVRARRDAEARAQQEGQARTQAESQVNDLMARLQAMEAEVQRLRGQP